MKKPLFVTWMVVAVAVFILDTGQANANLIVGNSINDDVSEGLQIANFSTGSIPNNQADYNRLYAIGFTMPVQSYTLTDVSVRLSQYFSYDGGLAYVSIVQDGGLNTPYGNAIPLVNFSPVSVGTGINNFTFTPSGTVTLAANTLYWLRVDPESEHWFLWMKAADAPTGVAAVSGFAHRYSDISDPYNTIHYSSDPFNPRFEIHGELSGSAPVPEPSTMVLMGSGLAGLVGYGRKRLKK